jgi:lactobin A/cerein 7B family class IIb bacteriocin
MNTLQVIDAAELEAVEGGLLPLLIGIGVGMLIGASIGYYFGSHQPT